MMRIYGLKTNHLVEPIGYQLNKVNLSWKVSDTKGKKTNAARILISLDKEFTKVVFDSGKLDSINSLAYQPDMKFEPKTGYYWEVLVWDDENEQGMSEPAYFEMPPVKFQENWIKAPFEKSIQPIFRKVFSHQESIKKARLYICGLGVYEAYLNGEKIGDEILAPFHNDYNLWLQYQTYDVTKYLNKGENCLGVMLGNGWYKGRFGFIDKLDCLFGYTLQFTCLLEITNEDGSIYRLTADESWKCKESPVIESSIYDGEVYDSRKEVKDWNLANGDETEFQNAVLTEGYPIKLQPRKSIPVRIKERIKPVELITTRTGEKVLDFGQNMTGWVEFECSEKKDTEILFQFGELLQEGVFYNENLRTAKEEYRYISNGEKQHVRPHFTFYGFRYMKVTGISEIRLEDFVGCVIFSDMEYTGKITTSNPKVNRLFLNALWGQKGNFLDVPTDCPQRDERMGWTGDAQVFSATASFNMYTPAFYSKYLYDMKLLQKTMGGSVPHVVPDILGVINRLTAKKGCDNVSVSMPHGSCAWGDAATIIPWNMYQYFGDKSQLEEEYQNMKMWVDYIKKVDDEQCDGSRLWKVGFHFADWLALDNYHQGSSFGGTDCYYIASAYYYYSTTLTAKAANVLGITEDAEYYSNLSKEIKAAIQKEYFTPSGRIAIDTQTALVVALYFDLVPKQHKERVVADLKKKLDEEKIHLTTGFVGTPYLCPVLTENGLADYAYTLLLNEDFPSWLYEVNMGATTIWERWNSVLPNGLVSDTGMNSMNHYSYGSIVEWMYRYMCGLQILEDQPGFKEFRIAPNPDERFNFSKMEYESAYGMIRSEWKYQENEIEYHITIPFDTKAEFVLPNKVEKALLNEVPCEELVTTGKLMLTKGDYIIKCAM